MAEKLTRQQQMAVTNRGGKLLVSAAAGSGKTKVLVDRLLSYLTDPVQPADLDEFLIITYTKAAAAELRGKIASKLVERISENPGNRHLQQQMQRLYLTKISTVHAFCADILRENAYRLDISGDFRVAEETECQQLQYAVIDRLLDEAYENAANDSDFVAFADSQGLGRDDRQIPEIILKVYNSARCHLDPNGWLDWCVSVNDVSNISDAAKTVWGEYLISDLHVCLDLHIDALSKCVVCAELVLDMDKPVVLLQSIIQQLSALRNSLGWDEIRRNMDIDYGRLVFSKKCTDLELAEKIKAIRNACKKDLEKRLRRFADPSDQVLSDIRLSAAAARGLVCLVKDFSDAYDRVKKSRRILDFSDLEHKTLDLLSGKKRSGPTAIAGQIAQRFREIMVDEYQDSNAVQDKIFEALTQDRGNCFMVGDVKQSIYQFRLADPSIFLEKYNSYVHAENAAVGNGRKIMLSKNFRSGGGVIDAVNDVFSLCMSDAVGGLTYGEEEALREGVPHISLNDAEVELYGIDVQEDTYAEEAAFTANKIQELLDGKHMIRQGETLRPILAEDIVILLRSPGSVGREFSYALEQKGIRCTSGGGFDLLQTEEVSTLRCLLQIIRNPLQDIPLLAVLTSRVFGFTADDLARLRSGSRHISVYESLKNSNLDKVKQVINVLTVLREEARLLKLSQLLEYIFETTRMDSIYASLPDGEFRSRNLQRFCQYATEYEACGQPDVGQFLDHLNALDDRGLTVAGEESTSGTVTIMSIHKSKGLEFPVVFLCGLAREFNRESARAQVLCDKELGLGLSCADLKNRVRYPTLAKRAIAAKIISESLSEEMRVLYVAMTRARDRLIMTYAARNLQSDLSEIAMRTDMSAPRLLSMDADCPGRWILQTALQKTEAGAFFALGGKPDSTVSSNSPWLVRVVQAAQQDNCNELEDPETAELDESTLLRIKDALSFRYPYVPATTAPSKQTATQLKGRVKDQESAEHTLEARKFVRDWRVPAFVGEHVQGKAYGNIIHTIMQYICYTECGCIEGIDRELTWLVEQGYISEDQKMSIDSKKIEAFFLTDIGKKLVSHKNILREFKFSVLNAGSCYDPLLENEQILLQGVVDCALIDDDGITIIDFKTDRVTDETLPVLVDKYSMQVRTYADALSRIYALPVKSKQLYLFHLDRFVEVL